MLVPESLAYATIAGVSPVVGLYAAAPALAIYALLGSSRHLVVAPMSATAALSASVVGAHLGGMPGGGTEPAEVLRVTVLLALLTGAVGIAAGLLRLGFLAAFVSTPVLKGFVVGLAATILLGQLPHLLGIETGEGSVLAEAVETVTSLGGAHLPTAAVGLGALVLLLGLRRVLPRWPGALVVVALGIAVSALAGLDEAGVAVVGQVPSGLPGLGLPGTDLGEVAGLLGPAAALLLVGFVEGLAAAKTYAAKEGRRIDPDRELVATGASDVGSGLVGGMVVNGSLSKTAVMGAAGGRTQLANLVVAGLTVLTLLLLTGLFEQLPQAVLAAVVVTAVLDLLDVRGLRALWALGAARGPVPRRSARADAVSALGALLGVLVLGVLPGLLVGVVLSVGLLLYRVSRPRLARLVRLPGRHGIWVDRARHRQLPVEPGVAVVRVEGPLFFGNAEQVRDDLAAAAEEAGALVLDAESIASLDVTAADALVRLAADLAARGIPVVVACSLGPVRDLVSAETDGRRVPMEADLDAAVALARTRRADARPSTTDTD